MIEKQASFLPGLKVGVELNAVLAHHQPFWRHAAGQQPNAAPAACVFALRLWLIDQNADDTDWVQSILRLEDPLTLPMSYTQAMMLALIWQPAP